MNSEGETDELKYLQALIPCQKLAHKSWLSFHECNNGAEGRRRKVVATVKVKEEEESVMKELTNYLVLWGDNVFIQKGIKISNKLVSCSITELAN